MTLTVGLLLLAAGALTAALAPRAREAGIVAAIAGAVLIILALWPGLQG